MVCSVGLYRGRVKASCPQHMFAASTPVAANEDGLRDAGGCRSARLRERP